MVITDVNIINKIIEAFAQKILVEQQGAIEKFYGKIEYFFDGLCHCTIDGTLHITEIVWGEFKPEKNEIWQSYRGNKPHFDELKSRIEVFFKKWPIGYDEVAKTRLLRPVPKSESATPESNDLTLLALALSRGAEGVPVIIATMDEALLDVTQKVGTLGMITWNQRTFKSARIACQTGLLCTEGAHRCCHISTDDFQVFHNYVLYADMMRMDKILDSGKKQFKTRDHIACIKAMTESAAAKAIRRAALQSAGQ